MPISPSTLVQLVQSQSAALVWWLRSRTATAEDVVQEAFCRLAIADPPPENAIAWLYATCRNLAENARVAGIRRKRREEHVAPAECVLCDVSSGVERAELAASVDQLPAELREVLVARIWGQLSLTEIASLMHVSVSTVHRRYEAALQTLRAQWKEAEERN